MSRSLKLSLFTFSLVIAGLLLPTSADAAAGWDLYNSEPVNGLKYKVMSSDPGVPNGDECASGSGFSNLDIVIDAAIVLNPPFSGSADMVRYLSLCSTDVNDPTRHGTEVFKMEIKLSSCFSWVCSTNYSYQSMHNTGVTYSVDMVMLLNAGFHVMGHSYP